MQNITKLIAIYARVSTSRQEEEETIKTQLLAIKDFAEKNGFIIAKEYIDDGWSGATLERPALDQLRIDAKEKTWEAILIYDPDRIARDYVYQTIVKEELEKAGKELLFVTTPSPKTPEEEMLFGVKGIFSKYERLKIMERTRFGKIRKAREGHIVLSEAPYGYNFIPKHNGKQGHLEINKEEAEIVKMIFSWIADEKITIRGAIKKLQELNIKPRESKRGVWNTSTLSTLLRNTTYIGKGRYGRTYAVVPKNPLKKEGYKKIEKTSRKIKAKEEWVIIPVPAIINEELFEQAGKQLKNNFTQCQRNRKNEYLLAGKIYCACGRKRMGEGQFNGKHLYYRCTDRIYSYPLPKKCHEKGINAKMADLAVWEKTKELMSSPDLILKQAKEWFNKQSSKTEISNTDTDSLKKEMEKLKKEENRYIEAYGAELISIEKLKEYTFNLRERITSLQSQMSALEQQKSQSKAFNTPSNEELESFCKRAQDMLNYLSFEKKREIINEIIEKIAGNKEELTVSGYLPVLPYNYEFKTIHRNRRIAKCRKIHIVQRLNKKTG